MVLKTARPKPRQVKRKKTRRGTGAKQSPSASTDSDEWVPSSASPESSEHPSDSESEQEAAKGDNELSAARGSASPRRDTGKAVKLQKRLGVAVGGGSGKSVRARNGAKAKSARRSKSGPAGRSAGKADSKSSLHQMSSGKFALFVNFVVWIFTGAVTHREIRRLVQPPDS